MSAKSCRSSNCRVTVPTRHPDHGKTVLTLPWVDVVVADVHDEARLGDLVRGHDAVVNLIAILHGNQDAFDHVHVALPQKLVRACQAEGVRRVVHVSALGAAAGRAVDVPAQQGPGRSGAGPAVWTCASCARAWSSARATSS
jgi:nucleoside-diphosphate-sugar epimerase